MGLIWAFIQPCAIIAVLWFVFSFGLKMGDVEQGIPFPLWLVVGIIPWFFISETILGGQNSIQEYSFLIKNINFRAGIIPIIKILSSLMIHCFFICVIAGLSMYYGNKPTFLWLQVFYFLFASLVLLVGLSWLLSSVTVFVKDIGQVVSVLVQLLFWLTPIFWNYKAQIPPEYHIYLKFNPFFYLVEGYRHTFIYHIPFWESLRWACYYWTVTGFLFVTGAVVFKKLRPHFADVV